MRRSIQSFLCFCTALALAASLTSACNAPSTEANNKVSLSSSSENPNRNAASKADVIYQAFNMRFRDIKAQLPELQNLGYTYIQVSPPQKSNPSPEWWARYQPIDRTIIESPLGTEKELKELINAATFSTLCRRTSSFMVR
jgi:alpha-amylase